MRVKINGQLGSANSLYNSFLLFLRLLLTILASAAAVSAQQKTLSQEKRLEIEKAVSTFMSANSVPGMGAAVVLDGEPVWSAGFGMADLEDSAPATSSTLFRLGSLSKPITATALLQLWEHGKLDLDAPVQEYCPAFPQKEWPITSRELLGHLGSSYTIPGGGLISSADDMARFEAAMLADKFVKRPARDLMWTPQKTPDGKSTGYALGWGISDKFGIHIVAHTGGQQGTSTAFVLVPERRAGVIVLANMDSVDSGNLADQILKIALGLKD